MAKAVAYAAPLVGGYFLYLPMWGLLPGIYAKYFGLEMTAVASVLLFSRILDGVPILGSGFCRIGIAQGVEQREKTAPGTRLVEQPVEKKTCRIANFRDYSVLM